MTAVINVDTAAEGVPISPDIYGQYLEHVEDCVEPGLITEQGLSEDVIEAARDLGVPAIRWPGGCFADVYHWRDGIGPDRPARPNWHWGNGEVESNRFGTHEFLDWCEQVGATPYINVNLGSGDLIEALRWLDYCSGSADTADVLARRANGRTDPWRVGYWGIGNETWGSWEAGWMDAGRYADVLDNWAGFFHKYDPDATIVGVGSSEGLDPDWDRTVLQRAGSQLGLLSLHVYAATVIGEADQRRSGLVQFPSYLEQRITAMAGLVREHNRVNGHDVGIALDEWNIRHWRRAADGYHLDRADPRSGSDALCAAGFFHSMIKNADVVRMANYVFLVNGNGVLDARGGGCRPTTLAAIFQAYRRNLHGAALPVTVDGGPVVPTARLASGHPDGVADGRASAQQTALSAMPSTLPALDVVASRAENVIRLALINRSDQPVDVHWSDVARLHLDQFVVDTRREVLDRHRSESSGAFILPAWSTTIAVEA